MKGEEEMVHTWPGYILSSSFPTSDVDDKFFRRIRI